MKTKIFDLTPRISPRLAVFPGDQPFSRQVSMSFGRGNHLELSSMLTTLHLGAHADAPSHYHAQGDSIERRSLSRYLGKAQVIRLSCHGGDRLRLEQLQRVKIQAPRVLIDTQSFKNPENWTDQFGALSADVINWLAQAHVVLVGIDTPSIDPASDKDLASHKAVFAADMAILEGLVLAQVPEGIYSLIALPLPIEGADASPVRAILTPHTPQLDELE